MSPRRIGLLVLALACAAAGTCADEAWIKVATPHFTILTPAGESVARKWAVELEQFRRGLQATVPVAPERLRPVTVVLFGSERAMEPFVPLERGKPARIGGMFVRANDINTIMLSVARPARETRHVIFHEAVHWHLSALEVAMPLWLVEGLAELYATFTLPDAKSYAFGTPMAPYVAQLQGGNFLPLPQLLAIERDSLLYNEGTRAGIFYAQSWAFVHFLFYGADSPGPESVRRFLALRQAGRAPDAAFAEAFGGNYEQLEARLRRYVREGSYHTHVYPRRDGPAERLVISAATAADLELAKGALLFGTRSPEEARPHLRLAATFAPGDPRAWELLGHVAIARREFEAATEALSKAVAAGSTSYLAYHHLAVSRLPQPLIAEWQPFSPADLDLAAGDYRRAIALAPSHVPSYEGLAGLVYGMETFVPEDRELLARGLAQAPGNVMIAAGLAAAEIRSGATAAELARLEQLAGGGENATDSGRKFARDVLADERMKGDVAAINEASRQRRFDEALGRIEHALKRDALKRTHRRTLEELRVRMQGFAALHAAVACVNAGEVSAGRSRLRALAGETTDENVRAEAQRILTELDGRERSAANDH